jgi:hypothetical protein
MGGGLGQLAFPLPTLKAAPYTPPPLPPPRGRDTAALARDIIAAGVQAVITCVDPKKLPASFAGRTFDADFLADLPPGVDPCGENGEFHSFVFAAPRVFDCPIAIHKIIDPRLRVVRGGFVYYDVVPSDISLDDAAAESDKAQREAAAADAAAAASAAAEAERCPIDAATAAATGGLKCPLDTAAAE